MNARGIQEEIIRRGEIASSLFNWSPAHMAGFVQGVAEAIALPDKESISRFSDDYGFEIEDFCFAGMERKLSDTELTVIGRFEAFKAVRSWFVKPCVPSEDAMLSQMKFWYLSDSCNFDVDEAVCEYIADFPLSEMLAERPASDWIDVIKVDHKAQLSEGGEGYVDLVVEKHESPYFLADRGEGMSPGVFDGFHRIGAALAVGDKTCSVVFASGGRQQKLDATFLSP